MAEERSVDPGVKKDVREPCSPRHLEFVGWERRNTSTPALTTVCLTAPMTGSFLPVTFVFCTGEERQHSQQ